MKQTRHIIGDLRRAVAASDNAESKNPARATTQIPKNKRRTIAAKMRELVPQVAERMMQAEEREAAKAKADVDAGNILLQRQMDRKAALENVNAERERLVNERLEATRKEDEEKAARIKQQLADDEKKRADREEKRKQAAKQWELEAPLREQRKQADALQASRDKAAKEMAHRKHVSAIVDVVNGVFENDALYKRVEKLPDSERLKEALQGAAFRFKRAADEMDKRMRAALRS